MRYNRANEVNDIVEMAGISVETPATPVVETPTPIIEAPKAETPVETTVATPEATPIAEAVKTPEDPSPIKVVEPAKSERVPEVTPEVDYAKILGEMSGGKVKSAEDLQRIINEHQEAQAKLADPYVEYAEKLSAWEDEGRPAELFHAVQTLDTDELSVDDAIKLKLKIDNPNWTREKIELYVSKTYNQDADKYDESDVEFGKLRMETDAAKAIKELDELKSKTVLKNDRGAQEAQARQAESERKEAWKQNLPSIVNGLTKVSLQLDGKGAVYEYTVSPEQRQEMNSVIENIVQNAPVLFDEKGKEIVNEILRKEFISKNINQIAQSINTHINTKKTEEKIVEIHNPTGAVQPANPVPATSKKSAGEEITDQIFAIEDGKRRRG